MKHVSVEVELNLKSAVANRQESEWQTSDSGLFTVVSVKVLRHT